MSHTFGLVRLFNNRWRSNSCCVPSLSMSRLQRHLAVKCEKFYLVGCTSFMAFSLDFLHKKCTKLIEGMSKMHQKVSISNKERPKLMVFSVFSSFFTSLAFKLAFSWVPLVMTLIHRCCAKNWGKNLSLHWFNLNIRLSFTMFQLPWQQFCTESKSKSEFQLPPMTLTLKLGQITKRCRM